MDHNDVFAMTKYRAAFTLWQWLAFSCTTLMILVGVELLVRNEQQRLNAEQLQQQLTLADKLRAQLETELNIPLYLTVGLASYITAKSGNLADAELDSLLPGLVMQAKHVRNIGIAPDNRLSYIFPLAGNEGALNLYYPDLPEQWPVIATIIENRTAQLTGPIQLRQGGIAFAYRYPLYMADGHYWGIISTVIDIEPIWQQLADNAARLGVNIALRNQLPDGGVSQSFFGENQLFSTDNLQINVGVRGANWQMALSAPQSHSSRLTLLRAFLYVCGFVIMLLLYRLFHTLQRLQFSHHALADKEQTLRVIHDNVQDAVITVDAQGVIQTANPACYRIFERPPESVINTHWHHLLCPSAINHGISERNTFPQTEVEGRGRRANGDLFDLLISHTLLPLERKQHVLIVLRDITERKRVERLQNDFVATVSHELRTPLTAINGTLGLALGGALGALNDKQLKMLTLAQQSCKQLHQLVNDLLDFEKLHNGKMAFNVVPLALMPLLEQCIAELNTQQNRKITIESVIQVSCWVMADETRLRQVCINLLANALKFSAPDTEIRIVITQEENHLRVGVIDQGKGIPPAFEPLLFARFAQANSVAVREQGGTGLGLAICKEIISQLQGHIGYQRLTPGSCFYFTLPLAQPQ